MRLSRAAVHRPVFTVMVMLVVIILGGVSLMRLPVDLMPDITYPRVSISTDYEGAGPEEIETLISRPIEEAMSAVPGVEEVTSTSVEGSSRVRVSFAWGTDLDAASNDIRDRLDRVVGRLPDEASRPRLMKFDLSAFPILMLGAQSDLDPIELRRIIDDEVKYRIERVPGVASMDVWGGLYREIHVNLDRDKLKAVGLSLNQIIAKLEAGNVDVPAGQIERGNFNVTIRTPGEYGDLEQVKSTVIAMQEGVPIRIADVAEVKDSWQRVTREVRVNGKPGVRVAVNKQSGKNTVEVVNGVLAELEQVNKDIPQIHITPIMNSADYIQRSISNVGSTALWGGLLAVLVLLFFLRNLRSTAVIATAIPISIIATFALMYFADFTLNIMTLGGIALGIGMLVDNSIVVLENIYRLREGGMGAEAAAVQGTEEVTDAIISSTLTTVAVFLPMVFVRGISGVMFKQLAFVVGFALFCSLGVALTLVPMLSARVLGQVLMKRGEHETLGHRLVRLTAGIFEGMEAGYKSVLHWVLDHRLMMATGAACALGGSLLLIPWVGEEFMPKTDEGEVRVDGEMAVGTRLEVVDAKFKRVEGIVGANVPEAKNVVASVGGGGFGGASGSHTAQEQVSLVPQAQRKRSSEEIAAELRKKLSGIPGLTIRTRAGTGLATRLMGGGGTEQLQVEVRGYDLDTADALAARVQDVVEKVDGVTDTRVSRQSGTPEELIEVDRQKAADMKLTVSEVANTLQTVLSGTTAGYYRVGGNEYPIVVKVRESERLSLDEVLDLTVTNSLGEQVVLRNVIATLPRKGPVSIERKDQERIVKVSANVSADRDLGSIINDTNEQLKGVPVPRGFSVTYGGDYEEQQKAFKELLLSIVLALVLVYMVMACQYESLRDPFVVMFSVPFAAIGVVLVLFLTGTTFNVQSYIGCIMLGGIVVNNAILLVDHTNLLRRRDGMELRAAIEEAGRRRLRPILMTAATTSLGLLPLALGLGEGGEAQAPLARAVIGGLMSSTIITLVLVPVVYSIFERGMKRSRN